MKTLQEIINKFGSDKNLSGYTPTYTEIFESIRDKNLNLLEIGIGTVIPGAQSSMASTQIQNYKPGASLRAWKDYFSYSLIYGGDIQEDTQFTEERIQTFLFDSTNKEQCDDILKDMEFDVIIDDGWHSWEAQKDTITNLFSRVKVGGYYIIEDIENGGANALFNDEFENLKKIVNNNDIQSNSAKNLIVIHKNH
jgi:hypothetical protein